MTKFRSGKVTPPAAPHPESMSRKSTRSDGAPLERAHGTDKNIGQAMIDEALDYENKCGG